MLYEWKGVELFIFFVEQLRRRKKRGTEELIKTSRKVGCISECWRFYYPERGQKGKHKKEKEDDFQYAAMSGGVDECKGV